jgi:aspartate aminotransferase
MTARLAPNLALDQLVRARIAAGEPVLHLGFGESRIPVPSEVVERLTAGAKHTAYGPVAGELHVRLSAAGYFARRNLPTDPDQIVLAPGCKALLMALAALADGDVLLPGPCWVTYAAQARLFRRRLHHVPVPDDVGGVPEPDALRAIIRTIRGEGGKPGLLVLTIPDNPTGTTAQSELVRELCEIARRENLTVVSDEINRDLLHSPDIPILSPAEVLPDQTVVVTGLSKSLALGGWRIGLARFPDTPDGHALREAVLGIASQVWSTLAGPMQEVAAYALSEPQCIRDHFAASARLHGIITSEVHKLVVGAGFSCRVPTGGFYVYPDFAASRDRLEGVGVVDSQSLQAYLLEELGVAVLAGVHFGDSPGALRFRAATSLLSGDRDEHRAIALAAADPLHLPWVQESLDVLAGALGKLAAL